MEWHDFRPAEPTTANKKIRVNSRLFIRPINIVQSIDCARGKWNLLSE